MWLTLKYQNFSHSDLLILGYLYSFISILLGGFLVINGYSLYSSLALYAPIIGSEFYKTGFCIGIAGSLLIFTSLYGAMALKEQSFKLLQFYACLIVLTSFSIGFICLSGFYFTKIPDICLENVGVYGRMYNFFMSNDKPYDKYLMREMQQEYNCCGVDSIQDLYKKKYLTNLKSRDFPPSCFPENTCSIERFANMENGCFHKIASFINRTMYSNVLIGIVTYIMSALGISILHTINVFLRHSTNL